MKKSLIATGAASLALAAMPVVGVFAYDNENMAGTVTDHLTVNIPASCTIQNANSTTGGTGDQTNPALNNYYYVKMSNGEFKTDIGVTDWDDRTGEPGENMTANNQITVSCNTASDPEGDPDPAGWVLTAIGAGTTGHLTDLYNSTANASIATGTATSGATSNWAFKVVKGDGANVSYDDDYTSTGTPIYTAVPSTELDIANGAGSFAGGFTMTYQVYVNQTQAQGTYTGAVKYTLYNPAV